MKYSNQRFFVNVLLSWKDCVLWKDSNIIGTDNDYDIFSGLQIIFGGSWMFRKQYCETRIRDRDKLLWKVLEFYLVLILVKFWCNTFYKNRKDFTTFSSEISTYVEYSDVWETSFPLINIAHHQSFWLSQDFHNLKMPQKKAKLHDFHKKSWYFYFGQKFRDT